MVERHDAQPVEAQPVEAQPVEAQPVEAQPVEAQPVEQAVPEGVPSLLEQARKRVRRAEKALARYTPLRMSVALPRTARFVVDNLLGRRRAHEPGRPRPALSPGLLAQVAMDEAILLTAMGPNRFPTRSDYHRVGAELRDAKALYEERGWLDDPASYHRAPPPLGPMSIRGGWALGVPYERFSFESGYEPHHDEPGRDRWLSYEPNRTAQFIVLRHHDGPRPWIVCIHGFGTGYAFMDIFGFKARKLHRELGLNVVIPVLPMHGPRKVTRLSGEMFLSFDLMNTVHGLAQSMWDTRRVLSWVREQEPTSVGVYGVSLGGYTTALLSGLEGGLDYVIAGIPVIDFPALFSSHAPHNIRMRSIEHNILDGTAAAVHGVVSPLALKPRVPLEERFIYAGAGDRMAKPEQAYRLWKHWDEPLMVWYPGNHVGFLWSGVVDDFVREALDSAGALTAARSARAG